MIYIDEYILENLDELSFDKKINKRKSVHYFVIMTILTKIVYDVIYRKNMNKNETYSCSDYIIKNLVSEINDQFSFNRDIRENKILRKYIKLVNKGFYISEKNYKLSEYVFTDKMIRLITNIKENENHSILCFSEEKINKCNYGIEFEIKYLFKNKKYNSKIDIANDCCVGKSIKERTEFFKNLNALPIYTHKNIFEDTMIDRISTNDYNIKCLNPIQKHINEIILNHKTEINVEQLNYLINDCIENYDNRNLLFLYKIKSNVNKNILECNYFQSSHGRLYLENNPLQMLPKSMRKRLLSSYMSIDISSAVYSILYNYGIKNNYTGNLSYIKKYLDNTSKFRKDVYEKLKPIDNTLTENYVKTFITSIPYGSCISENYVRVDIKNKIYNSVACKIDGFSDMNIPLTICQNFDIINLSLEIKELSKWVVEQFTFLKNDKKYIKNIIGNSIEITKGMRIGKKISHIYQSLEYEILNSMIHYKDKNEKSLIELNKIGLCLHDGIYIKKDNNIINDLTKNIQEKYNYNIKLLEE